MIIKQNIIWQSVRFETAIIGRTEARRYSNGDVLFFDFDGKGKRIREYWLPDAEVSNEVKQKLDGFNKVVI